MGSAQWHHASSRQRAASPRRSRTGRWRESPEQNSGRASVAITGPPGRSYTIAGVALDSRRIARDDGEDEADFLTSQQHLDPQVANRRERARHQNGDQGPQAALQRTARDEDRHTGRDDGHRHDPDDRPPRRVEDLPSLEPAKPATQGPAE